MKFLPLLGKRLKDDEIMDILEVYDAEVIYDFDRLHENIPDQYWAACKDQGIQFGFDANQVLSTIFLYLESREGFTRLESINWTIFKFSTTSRRWKHTPPLLDFPSKKGVKERVDPSQSRGLESIARLLQFITSSLDRGWR